MSENEESKAIKIIGLKMVKPDTLTPTEELSAAEPSKEMLQNVGNMGAIIQSIVVRKAIDKRNTGVLYDVLGGNRRLKAARICKLKLVPVLIVEGEDEMIAATITLTENNVRGRNVATDIVSIKTLVKGGLSREQISETWGIAPALLKSRLELDQNLIPALMKAFLDGKISETVAISVSRLGIKDQKKAKRILDKDGTLTMPRVRELSDVSDDSSIDEVDDEVFATSKPDKKKREKWIAQLSKTEWEHVSPQVMSEVLNLLSKDAAKSTDADK